VELITTHVGADFDALASVLAARRLHPGAEIFFPGSREESVRRMLDTGLVAFNELRQKDVNPEKLQRVVLCDTRQPDRLGVVGEWLAARPEIEVVAYDHHPPAPTDLPHAGGLVDPAVGSTSTLLVEEFRRRQLSVGTSEATVLLLGIYEDTGALTYATTHSRDLEAAAWLLERGAELQAVRRFALRQLDAVRLDILHRMTQALEVRRVHGHRVGLVALELGEYIDELAPLVSRCLELYDLALLFAFFGERERLTVIARGEVAGFDLGACLAEFAGGGGHATAAAASLKETTAIEARERLLLHLERVLPPAARVSDLMLTRFFVVTGTTAIAAAKAQLNEWRVNAAPVVDAVAAPAGTAEEGAPEVPVVPVIGVVTRQTLDAALQHGLGERPVLTVVNREVEWVAPDAPAEEIGRLMLQLHPRLVLVGDRATGRPVGIVTRMALLRHLHGRLESAADPAERRARELRAERQRIARLLEERLPPALLTRLRTVADVAREHSIPVYLVGGIVRDLLLGRDNRDLDLVVEGDGPHFARLLAAALGGRVREHRAFLTAVVVDREGLQIDVATARSEFYRAPAALPEVVTSPLRQDLYRRDFTINTLAIRLGPGEPELIDYFGARRDLEEGTLRVLHSLSLIDDPTRVLRAVRLEVRLGFRISPETLRLVQVALAEGVFERLSGARLRDELVELLAEPAAAARALERLAELRLLTVLHPRLALDSRTRERLQRTVAAHDWFRLTGLATPRVEPWRLMLLALAAELDAGERRQLAGRLQLAGENRRLLVEFAERLPVARAALRAPAAAPHEVSAALAALGGEELLLAMAEEDEEGRRWLRRELLELRPLALRLRGRDLVAHGFPPGPHIGRALAATRAARLDAAIGPEQELEHALGLLRAWREAPAAAPAPALEER
jgi:tRNA nucleotidyltransferase (CCA-adding enzyme)